VICCKRSLPGDTSGLLYGRIVLGCCDFGVCLLQRLAVAKDLINHCSSVGVVVETIFKPACVRHLRRNKRRFGMTSKGYRNESTCRCATFETMVPAVEGEELQKKDMSRLTL
jgi:hypothetical protein